MRKQAERDLKSFFKVIWAWEDDKEEHWLEQKALQGWHLVEVAPFFYKFKRESPRRVIYRLDYKGTLDKDYQEYLSIFQDSGWELVTRMSNWHYYRFEPDNNSVPELYSSNRTQAEKYRRLVIGLVIPLAVLGITFNSTTARLINPGDGMLQALYFAGFIARLLIMAFLMYGLIRLILKIRRLQSEPKE